MHRAATATVSSLFFTCSDRSSSVVSSDSCFSQLLAGSEAVPGLKPHDAATQSGANQASKPHRQGAHHELNDERSSRASCIV